MEGNAKSLVDTKTAKSEPVQLTNRKTRLTQICKSIRAATQRLEASGSGVDSEAYKQLEKHIQDSAGVLVKAAIKADYSEKSFADLDKFIRDLDRTAALVGISNIFALKKDLKSLARMRAVSKPLQKYVDSLIVHVIEHDKFYKQPITYAEINKHLAGYSFAGLHGTSSLHAPSLYKGLKKPKEEELNYAMSQLGPGFYLTQGRTMQQDRYALSIAEMSVKKFEGSPYLYPVLLRNFAKLKKSDVPQQHWNNMKNDKESGHLSRYDMFDLLMSVIVDNNPAKQIKVNPNAFEHVIIMPPSPEGNESAAWITARFSANDKKDDKKDDKKGDKKDNKK